MDISQEQAAEMLNEQLEAPDNSEEIAERVKQDSACKR